jgi:hypothetical protein
MANNCLTSWAKYVATPTNTSNGVYGTFWLNAGGNFQMLQRIYIQQAGTKGKSVYYSFKIHSLLD